MGEQIEREDDLLRACFERNYRTLYRICYVYLKNGYDAEDAAAEAFIRLIQKKPRFSSPEQESAWLIRTSINLCLDELRRRKRRPDSLEQIGEPAGEPELQPNEVLQAVMELPEKYRVLVYLHYYEGYTAAELARALKKPASTLRNQLMDARQLLKKRLGDELDE